MDYLEFWRLESIPVQRAGVSLNPSSAHSNLSEWYAGLHVFSDVNHLIWSDNMCFHSREP